MHLKSWNAVKLSSALLWAIAPIMPLGIASPVTAKPVKVAQLFYPPANQQKIIRVIGQGSVKQAADTAEIQILVDGQNGFRRSTQSDPFKTPLPSPNATRFEAKDYQPQLMALGKSITEEDLKPLAKVIAKAAGVSTSSVTVKATKSRSRVAPFPLPSLGGPNSVYVMVQVQQPTPNKVEKVIVAAENYLRDSSTLTLDDIKVNFKINECEQLKLDAFKAAVSDAQRRAEAIAEAMEAQLSSNASVAEPFFNMFVPGCDSGKGFSLRGKKNSYEPGDPIEVVIDRVIFFTYTLEEK